MARPMRLALCAAALLAACSTTTAPTVAPSGTPGVCTGGTCFVNVEVLNCTASSGGIVATPETLTVPAPNTIQWTLNTAGFKFPTNGIVVQGTGFTNPQVTGNGKRFLLFDDHSDRRPMIKYTVTVVRDSDGTTCTPYDPFINNQ